MTGHVKISGSWEELEEIPVRQSGSWQAIDEGHVKVSGAWEQFFSRVTYDLSAIGSSYSDTGSATGSYSITFRFATDATIDILRSVQSDILNIGSYVDPSSESSNLYIRCTTVSGQALSDESPPGSWISMGSTIDYTRVYNTGGGVDLISGVARFEIATDSGGTNIVATSADVTWEIGETF